MVADTRSSLGSPVSPELKSLHFRGSLGLFRAHYKTLIRQFAVIVPGNTEQIVISHQMSGGNVLRYFPQAFPVLDSRFPLFDAPRGDLVAVRDIFQSCQGTQLFPLSENNGFSRLYFTHTGHYIVRDIHHQPIDFHETSSWFSCYVGCRSLRALSFHSSLY